jgi:hypothetical protein
MRCSKSSTLAIPHKRPHGSFVLATVAALASVLIIGVPRTQAAITTPAGLSPGDQFRMVFVTSDTRTATSGVHSDYDSRVQALAAASVNATYNGSPVTWKALASTFDGEFANSIVLPASTVPIYRVDGVKVATGGADLWDGTILAAINKDEDGTPRSGSVWTGSDASGNGIRPLGINMPRFGDADSTTAEWMDDGQVLSSQGYAIYAVSDVLTVVPEPSAILIWGGLAGCGVLGAYVRRRFSRVRTR